MKQYKVGVVGLGQFAPEFIDLFRSHPGVSDVYVCDVVPDRVARIAEEFGLEHTFTDYEELLDSDVDAVAIFTQRWMHGEMAIDALRRGKHVYSAVPMAIDIEHVREIVRLAGSTGLLYMMGETSYYYPSVVYCRRKWNEGEFGKFVYGEGEYLHDMSHGFYGAFQYSGGDAWKATASFPPMLYPTHSLAMVLAVTGSYATSVSCLGFVDTAGDGVFDKEVSTWGNDFSNEVALFTTADGGSMRINEFRRVGIPPFRPEVRLSLYGTDGAFEQQTAASVWQTHAGWEDVRGQLETERVDAPRSPDAGVDQALLDSFQSGFAPVHDRTRLPAEYAGRHNGHEGSHQFLVDDFVTAMVEGSLPPVNAWTAARFTIPGLVAHQSALRGGERLTVPDLGDAPR